MIYNFNKIVGPIRPNLNLNGNMSVKGTSGIGFLACGGFLVYDVWRGKATYDHLKGCLLGMFFFGGAYAVLDGNDTKQQDRAHKHEEEIARINHPATSISCDKSEENKRPRYLETFDTPPVVRTLNDLVQLKGHELHQLVGRYLYEGDIAIFFSIANKGKTIAAIQMAIDMAKGESTIFETDTPPRKQNVWYYNFEMSEGQMKKRLTQEDGTAVEFPDNVLMIDCKGRYENADEFLDSVALDVEHKLTGDTVIFIDTITDICPSFFSKEVSTILRSLRAIQEHAKREKNFTLTLVLESHTTKIKDSESLGLDNMKGGVNQANLADSIFALGVAYGKMKNLRYMKLLKARNDEIPDTVDILEISKKHYVRPMFVATACEDDVLPPRTKPTGKGVQLDVSKQPSSDTPGWNGKLSLDTTIKMRDFYQKGVPGRGLEPTAIEFGLKYSEDVKRELEKLEEYLAATSATDIQQ